MGQYCEVIVGGLSGEKEVDAVAALLLSIADGGWCRITKLGEIGMVHADFKNRIYNSDPEYSENLAALIAGFKSIERGYGVDWILVRPEGEHWTEHMSDGGVPVCCGLEHDKAIELQKKADAEKAANVLRADSKITAAQVKLNEKDRKIMELERQLRDAKARAGDFDMEFRAGPMGGLHGE